MKARRPALANRVPAPPCPFEGREAELARLDSILHRGSAAVVVGLPGLGKSSLARRYVERTEGPALQVSFAEPAALGTALRQIVRALSVFSHAWSDAPPEATCVETLWEAALDLAEREGVVLVLEDVHLVTDWEDLLAIPLRFASSSRWLGVSRLEPAPAELHKQLLRVGPLARESLASLAAALQPALTAGEMDEHVRAAAGSPRALCASLFCDADAAAVRELPWEGAGAAAQRVAEALAILGRPLPPEVLGSLAGEDHGEGLRELVRRGIAQTSTQASLTSAARAQLGDAWLSRARAQRGLDLVHALAAHGDPEAALVGVEVALELGAPGAAARILRGSIATLIDLGHSNHLFAVLERATDPDLRELRLMAAAASLTSEGLSWSAAEPRPRGEDARLARAVALALAGNAELGWEEAHAVFDGTGDRSTKHEAALCLGRIARVRGSAGEAIRLISSLPEPEPVVERASRSAILGALHAATQQSELALREAQRALSHLAEMPMSRRFVASALVASTFTTLGLLRQHLEVLEGMRETIPWISAIPWWMLASAFAAMSSGDLEGAEALAERAAVIPQRLGHFAAFPHVIRLRIQTARGDAAAISAAREACLTHVAGLGDDEAAWIRALAWQASLVAGVDAEAVSATNDATGPGARAETAMAVIQELRAHGTGEPPASRSTDPVDVAILVLRSQAEALLARGDHAGAAAKVADALWLARTHGWALHEVELHGLRGDLLLLMGRSAALVGDELERVLPTPRFIVEARFLRLASLAPVPPAALGELLAQRASPIAARRAAALLDPGVALADAVDRAVVAAILGRADAPGEPRSAGKSVARSALAERAVRLRPDERVAEVSGRSICLARNELMWKLLQALAPGTLRSHEELVRVAWDTEYHPLRDDARLRVAIARLRKLLGRGPESPTIVSVAATGYELRQAH